GCRVRVRQRRPHQGRASAARVSRREPGRKAAGPRRWRLHSHGVGRDRPGDNVTVADFVTAYTLDMAAVLEKHMLLDNLPRLRGFMERMYQRPNAPPRIAEAFASLRR